MIEFNGGESPAFDEVMEVLKRYPDFEYIQMNDDSILSVPGLEIYPSRRKIYCGQKEISLTTKQYNLFYLLALNKGRVLTYGQIYRKVWGDETIGRENDAVQCQIKNLRMKLYREVPDAPFTIRCVKEVGYCFEAAPE